MVVAWLKHRSTDWLKLKRQHDWKDYDQREVFHPGGSHPHEMVAAAASPVRIYAAE